MRCFNSASPQDQCPVNINDKYTFDQHVNNECKYRRIPCFYPFPGCNARVPGVMMAKHLMESHLDQLGEVPPPIKNNKLKLDWNLPKISSLMQPPLLAQSLKFFEFFQFQGRDFVIQLHKPSYVNFFTLCVIILDYKKVASSLRSSIILQMGHGLVKFSTRLFSINDVITDDLSGLDSPFYYTINFSDLSCNEHMSEDKGISKYMKMIGHFQLAPFNRQQALAARAAREKKEAESVTRRVLVRNKFGRFVPKFVPVAK